MQQIVREVADPTELYDSKWLNRFRTQHRIAAKFREGRAFFAGDAAHVHVIGGQGMNTGISGCVQPGSWPQSSRVWPNLRFLIATTLNPVAEAIVKETDQGLHTAYQSKQLHRICAESVRVKRYPCRIYKADFVRRRNQHRIQGQSHCGRLRRQQWSRCR